MSKLPLFTTVFLICMAWSIPATQGAILGDIAAFLVNDTTDTHEWCVYHSCGHYSRALAHNASLQNITLGSVILGNHPVLRGYNNHIMNYIVVGNETYLIEPQTDEISLLSDSLYRYYRIYPDGSQVPSHWKGNKATKNI